MRRERVPTGSTDDYYTDSHQRESSTASYTPSVTSTAQTSYSGSGLGRSHSMLSKGTSRSAGSETTLQTGSSPRGGRNVGLGLESSGGKELDFEQLISSGETMKVTLTPNRLRTIEVDRNGSVKLEARNPYVKPTDNITVPTAAKSAVTRPVPSSRNGYQQREEADLEEYDSEDERMGYGPPPTEKSKPAESLVDFLKNTGPNGSSVDVASLPSKYNPAPKSAQPQASIMKKPTSPTVRAVDTEPERQSYSSGRSRPLVESAASPTRGVQPEMTAPSQPRSQYNSRVAVPVHTTDCPDMPPGPLPSFPVPPSRENSDSPSSNASPPLTSPRTPQASSSQHAPAQKVPYESSQPFPASSQEVEDDDEYDAEFEQFLLPEGQVNKRRAPGTNKNGMPKQLGGGVPTAAAAAAAGAATFNGQAPSPSKQMGGVGPRARKPTIDTSDNGLAKRSISPSSPTSPGGSRKHAQQDLLDFLSTEPPPSVTQSPPIPFQLSNFPSPKVGSSPDSPNVNKRDTGIRKLMSRLRRDSVTSGGSRESEEHWDNARERQGSVISVGSQKSPPMQRYEPASAGSAAILRHDNRVPRGTVPGMGPAVTTTDNDGQHSRQLSLADSNKDLPPMPKTPTAISNQSKEELQEPDRSAASSRRPSADSRTKEQRREHAAIGIGAGAAVLGAAATGLAVRDAKSSASSGSSLEKIPIAAVEPHGNGTMVGTVPSTAAITAAKDVAPTPPLANYIFGTSAVAQLVKAIHEATTAEQCQGLVSQFLSAGTLEQQQPIKEAVTVPDPIDDEGTSEFGREAFEQGAVAEWLLGSWGAEAPKEDNDDVATIHPADADEEPYTHGSEAYIEAAATEPAPHGGLAEHEEIIQESLVRKRDVPFNHSASEDRSTIYTMTTATEGFTDDEIDERDFEDNDDYDEEGERHMHQSAIDEALRAESRQSELM